MNATNKTKSFKVERINAYGYKVWLQADGQFSSDESATVIYPLASEAQRATVEAKRHSYVVDHTLYGSI